MNLMRSQSLCHSSFETQIPCPVVTLTNKDFLKKIWPIKICRPLRVTKVHFSRSRWPRGLRRWSAVARLLRLCIRISPGAWDVCLLWVLCLSGRGLCDYLITRREEFYRLCCVVVCDIETSWFRKPWPNGGLLHKKNQFKIVIILCRLTFITSAQCLYLSQNGTRQSTHYIITTTEHAHLPISLCFRQWLDAGIFLLKDKSNGSYKAWQFDGEWAIYGLCFWVVMPCGLLGEYKHLENINSIFSADVSIEGIWQII
jgi:hypothetical protein